MSDYIIRNIGLTVSPQLDFGQQEEADKPVAKFPNYYLGKMELCPTMVMTPEQLFEEASLTLDRLLQTGDVKTEQCQSLWTDKYGLY